MSTFWVTARLLVTSVLVVRTDPLAPMLTGPMPTPTPRLALSEVVRDSLSSASCISLPLLPMNWPDASPSKIS